jgi:hypothetical protein
MYSILQILCSLFNPTFYKITNNLHRAKSISKESDTTWPVSSNWQGGSRLLPFLVSRSHFLPVFLPHRRGLFGPSSVLPLLSYTLFPESPKVLSFHPLSLLPKEYHCTCCLLVRASSDLSQLSPWKSSYLGCHLSQKSQSHIPETLTSYNSGSKLTL